MNNKDNKFNNKAFTELLNKYKAVQESDESVFFDLDDLVDVSDYYYEEGDLQKAKQAAQYAMRLYPGALKPIAILTRMAMLNDNNVELAKQLVAMADDKNDIEYYYLQAEIMIMEERIDEADQYLEAKLHVIDDDDLSDFLIEVPTLFLDYNLPELAQKWMLRTDEKQSADYQTLEAKVAYSEGNYQKSETILHRLLDDEPFSTELWNCMASSQFMLNKVQESMESSEYAIAINPHDKDALLNKAHCLVWLGQVDKAVDYYKRCVDLSPDDCYLWSMYGFALQEAGRNEEAIAAFAHVEAESKDPIMVSKMVKETAYVMINMGKQDDVIVYLDSAESAHHINHVDRMVVEGYIHLAAFREKNASDCFLYAIINSKNDPAVCLQVACCYFDFGMFQQTHDLLAALFAQPNLDFQDGYAYLAYACQKLGLHDEFLLYLQKACEINPQEARYILKELFPNDCPVSNYVNYARQHHL